MNELTSTKPRRKRLRVTLGVMMFLVLAFACALGWIVHRARVQRLAVAAILKDGRGSVYYDWEYGNGTFLNYPKPQGPKWLRDALGPDMFDTVVYVDLRAGKLDDELMAYVGQLDGVERFDVNGGDGHGLTQAGMARSVRSMTRLEQLLIRGLADCRGFMGGLVDKPRLRVLRLEGASVTDEDMAVIGRLTSLEDLYLNGRNVTQVGFAQVANLTKMTSLDINYANITDLSPIAGLIQLDKLSLAVFPSSWRADASPPMGGPSSLEPLRRLSKLASLHLAPCQVGDSHLEILLGFPNLVALQIGGKGITDIGLARIAQMNSIGNLWLDDTSIRDLRPLAPLLNKLDILRIRKSQITNDGLAALAGATRLKHLMLTSSNLTDAGMEHVAGLKTLESLQLDHSEITDAGVVQLQNQAKLGVLTLNKIQITDASIPTLVSLKSLWNVHLNGTAITPGGLQTLKKALPNARIAASQSPSP